MNDRNNIWFPFAVSALAGLVLCLAIVMTTGRSDAWDSPVYFSVGIPVMCLSVFAVSCLFPVSAWRWTVNMARVPHGMKSCADRRWGLRAPRRGRAES